jgi:hypothetical protein
MYLPPLAITFGHGIVRVYSEGLLIISHVTSSSGDVQSFSTPPGPSKVEKWDTQHTGRGQPSRLTASFLAVRGNGGRPNLEALIEV